MKLIMAMGSALIAYGVAQSLIPLLINIAHRCNILDHPDSRLKRHKEPTAYLGGVAVYAAVLVACIGLLSLDARAFFLIAGVTILLFLGLIDDLQPQTPLFKFAGQAIAALCFLRGGLDLKHEFLERASLFPQIGALGWSLISALWIATVTNGFNLIDVMDGYAAINGIGASFLFGLAALLTGNTDGVILMSALCAGLCAFLRFNRPPAKIYLGDAGSLSVGGLLAATPFMITWGAKGSLAILLPILILAIPLSEVLMLSIIRTFLGIPFYRGSRHHAIHFLKDRGWSIERILIVTASYYSAAAGILYAVLSGAIGQNNALYLAITLFFFWIILVYGPKSRDVAFGAFKAQKQQTF
jgi:UDP-GlcNAc:undecaprenyl-phosphate GlcNAc-1-phosphate transferase